MAGTISAVSYLWDGLAKSVESVPIGIVLTGASVAAKMDLARFRQMSDGCDNCKKNY